MSLCSRLSFHRLDLSHQFVNLHIVVFLFTMRKSFEVLGIPHLLQAGRVRKMSHEKTPTLSKISSLRSIFYSARGSVVLC